MEEQIKTSKAMRFELLFNNLIGRIFLVSTVALATLSSIQLALYILLGAVIVDFLTGWLASWMEMKRGDKPFPESGYAFESNRARDSVVKSVGYIAFILGSLVVEYLFFDKKFEFTNLSTKKMGVTEIVVSCCIVIEMYSILIENLKRAGFDMVSKIVKIAESLGSLADTVWTFIKKIKGNG